MIPIVPQRLVKVRPDEPDPIDPRAKFELTRQSDWLTAAGTVLHFDDTPIGAEGALGAKAMTDLQVLRTTTKGAR
jgi:hypothetical protein